MSARDDLPLIVDAGPFRSLTVTMGSNDPCIERHMDGVSLPPFYIKGPPVSRVESSYRGMRIDFGVVGDGAPLDVRSWVHLLREFATDLERTFS